MIAMSGKLQRQSLAGLIHYYSHSSSQVPADSLPSRTSCSCFARRDGSIRIYWAIADGVPDLDPRQIGEAVISSVSSLTKTQQNRYPVPEWVHQLVYLHPYPTQLMLRSHV
jgi:hypothetical protein